MRKTMIAICMLISLAILLNSSGCCYFAGVGMENAKIKNQAKSDAWHKRACDTMSNF